MASRETAWYSWEEWINVKNLLYSYDKPEYMKEGLQMIDTWQSRIRTGTLPVAVELTATLISAYLATQKSSESNQQECQLASAMSIVRFVNGVTDQLQTGLYVESCQVLADRLDIPEWIVDLRHSATHSHLPSLEVLNSAIMFGLNWLYVNYWKETFIKIGKIDHIFYTSIHQYLYDYVDTIIEILKFDAQTPSDPKTVKEKKKLKSKTIRRSKEITSALVKGINQSNLKNVIKVLVQKGCFLPDEHLMRALQCPMYIDSLSSEQEQKLELLVNMWRPLLDAICRKFPSVFFDLVTKELLEFCKQQRDNTSTILLLSLHALSKITTLSHLPIIKYLIKNPSSFGFKILRDVLAMTEILDSSVKDNLAKFLDVFEESAPVLNKPIDVDIVLEKEMHPSIRRYYEILEGVEQSSSTRFEVKPNISKWTLISPKEHASLPPVGEFMDSNFSNKLRLKDVLDLGCRNLGQQNISTQKMHSSTTLLSDGTYNNNDNVKRKMSEIVNDLFTDTSILITDGESENESCVTDEYCMDYDMSWNDDLAEDKEVNIKPAVVEDVSNVDVTQISFY